MITKAFFFLIAISTSCLATAQDKAQAIPVVLPPVVQQTSERVGAPGANEDAGATEDAEVDDGLTWYDVSAAQIEGRILPNAPRDRWFDRLPQAAEGHVTKNVWSLSRDSAGMMVRFITDATAIHIHYKLRKKSLALPHMPATGVSGVDLYARDSQGKWRWVQVTRPTEQEMKVELVGSLAEGNLAMGKREFAAYLPLYNGVEFMHLGVEKGKSIDFLPPREQPIVFYGTSITHGACASRPGMVHTAILGRRFDMPVVNLGFSGNGRMDKAVGDYLVQVDAAAYVIDCLPNMNSAMVRAKCVPLVRQIRGAKPSVPIVLVEDRRNTNSWILPARDAHHTANHRALRNALEQLTAEGIENLFYISGDGLYGQDGDGATDGSHASDLGFFRQADAFEPVIRDALNL